MSQSKSELISSKKILVMISGSIAAYKSCHVISQLVQMGHTVQVVTTPAALEFVGPSTLEGLTGRAVVSEMYATNHAMDHIYLARWADLILLCPATANTINKMVAGLADDLVTSLFVAHDFTKPFLVAPAMNTAMYQHPITQSSLKKLTALGLRVLPTGSGSLACGEVGAGRLLEPEQILGIIKEELNRLPSGQINDASEALHSKQKRKVLITSGGTQERLDAMRVLTNLSTGQTGAFLAEALFDRGFEVVYLGASNACKPQRPCIEYTFTNFDDLNTQLQRLLQHQEFTGVVHAAAVSDFHVARITSGEQTLNAPAGKLSSKHKLVIELEPNFKILPRLKKYASPRQPLVIGFKYTATENLEQRKEAVQRLFMEGGVDWVVHNDHADIDKARGIHSFTLYSNQQQIPLPDRLSLADALADHLEKSLQKGENTL